MNLRNITVGTQLKLGLAIMAFMVLVLGSVAYLQTARLHAQTESMYLHPLQVRRAIGSLTTDIFAIHRDLKDLAFSSDPKDIDEDLASIEAWRADAFSQIEVIYGRYLGSKTDVDSIRTAFVGWNSTVDETIRRLRSDTTGTLADREKKFGDAGDAGVDHLQKTVQKADDFARKKGDALFLNSVMLNRSLNLQLFAIVAIIMLISFLINFLIMRNIRRPLVMMSTAMKSFREGNLASRSPYAVRNEFGVLSDSFNALAETVQLNSELSQKAAHLAGLMLSEDNAKKFFHATLNALLEHTGSNIAAAYLLNADKNCFEHFESIGAGDGIRQSFAVDNHEGEFGAAVSSRKIQHIKNIPDNTRFSFHTISGSFIPHEIITIPVLSGKDVVAVISLAAVSGYSKKSIQLINSILDTLGARVDGILAYRKMEEISAQLKIHNAELQAQKSELSSQSAELVSQNRELEIQKQQLDEAGRLKTTFLSNMSHELRTPLNSVIALSGVLHRRLLGKLSAEEYSYIEIIERNGKLLLELINDILDIARIESGREEIEITGFAVGALIADVAEMIRPQAEEKNIALTCIAAETVLNLESDLGKCRHILQNIVGNAVKFTEKGSVEISTRRSGEAVEITVTDTGIGIASEHLPHIFDEFRQADGSTSRRYGGTGLGLSIAKKYAAILGGSIVVSSEPGKGSVFTIRLPLRLAGAGKAPEFTVSSTLQMRQGSGAKKPVPKSSGRNILLVEDSDPAIIQMCDILEGHGYKIIIARDGGEALSIIENIVPDAIILDLMMSGKDGFEVLETVRGADATAHVPVLILTAKHITKDELSFLKRNHIHQLIQKGNINRDQLLASVASMIPEPAPTLAKSSRLPQKIEGHPVVLVIEDNPDNMVTIKAILGDSYTILEAENGHAGEEIAKKELPHIILMDIGLPGRDGIAVFRSIRTCPETAHIPIVAVTASAMTSDREKILAEGFDAYLPKPIIGEQFLECIRRIVHDE